ncbi:MAG: 4Fe-4S dicluster domain-containing protein [Granulosicoccus sp.]|nr:4Fe-4S dicluster domain-containing protein [Granulosicoccus sp.]
MDKSNPVSTSTDTALAARRRFLQKIGALGAVATVSSLSLIEIGARAATSSKAVTPANRWGLLIDTAKCASGCDDCVRGCHEEHGITSNQRDATDAQWIRKIDLQDNLTGRQSSLPMMCQHCDSAPCVDVCPTGASFKRADGVVLVNKHTCIGCRYCVMACPYKARSFIHEDITDQKTNAPRGKGTVEGCTLCVHRIDAGGEQQPACAEACTAAGHNAILFGDLNDANSQISVKLAEQGATQVRADLQLNTGVRYTQL